MKEAIKYIKTEYAKNQRVPSIANMCKKIKGLNRSNFYVFFPQGLGEACEAAGVPTPEKRIKSTKKASKTRVTEKSAFSGVSLKEEHKQQLMLMKYMEHKEPDEILDEMFENYFTLQRDFKLNNHYTNFLSRFLIKVQKTGMDETNIINLLARLYKIGLGRMSESHFNKSMQILDHMIIKGYNEKFIDWLLLETKNNLLIGYTKCILDCQYEINNILSSKQIFNHMSITNQIISNLYSKHRNYEQSSLEELTKVMV
jgi:hypothetical protein